MESTGNKQTCQAAKCSQHPLESIVLLCMDCKEVICYKCLLINANPSHKGHEAAELSDGIALMQQAVVQLLCGFLDGAKLFDNSQTRLQQASVGNTATIIDQVNTSIDDAIAELETIRTNLTTDILRSAQQHVKSSVPRAAQLTNLHLGRSSLQSVKRLYEQTECANIDQLKSALELAEIEQRELEQVAVRQKAVHEQLRAALAQPQKIGENWKDEIRATHEHVDSLRQYTDDLVVRRPRNQQKQSSAKSAANGIQSDLLFCFGGLTTETDCSKQILMYNPTSDKWYNAATLTYQRYGAAAAVWNNTVIVAGGAGSFKSVEQYDPESNTCKSFPNLQVGRFYHQLVNVNGVLYAIGGRSAEEKALNSVEKFDESSNSWLNATPLNTPRWGLAASVLQNRILVASGCDGSNHLSSCQLYDSNLKQRSSIASLNRRRWAAAAATYDNTVYVFGGNDGSHDHNDAEQYNRQTDKWTLLDIHMSVARNLLAAATVGNAVYLLGGFSPLNYTDAVEHFDFATKKLFLRQSLPSVRHALAAVGVRVSDAALARLSIGSKCLMV